jgi:hypothetical protein
MTSAWGAFFSLMHSRKKILIAASACLLFLLGSASQIHAQSVAEITGVAGFETGLQVIASVRLAHVSKLGDTNPPGATIGWGDDTSDSQGLLVCSGGENDPCTVYGSHWYGPPKTYTISITYNDPAPFLSGPGAQHTLTTTATITPPGRFVILSIGDSIASGEGNPNEPNNVGNHFPGWSFWDDAYSSYDVNPFPFPHDEFVEWTDQAFPCHRSSYAGPAQAAGQLTAMNPGSGITFIHYACSGATVEPGDTDALWVQDAVGQLKVARARLAQFGAGIDILLISAGSNSLYGPSTFLNGFGGLASYCLNNGGCSSNNTLQKEVNSSFSELPTYYKNLAMEINCQQPPPFTGAHGYKYLDPDPGCTDPKKQIPKLVLMTEYMDPTHDENGNFPQHPKSTCGPAFIHMVQGDFEYLYNGVVVPLNSEVDSFPAYAQEAGLTVPTYTVPNIALDFKTHGACSGSERWVNNGHDSEQLLGAGPHPHPGAYPEEENSLAGEKLNGMLHPNSGVLAGTLPWFDFIAGPSCSPFCGQEDYAFNIVQSVQQYNPPVTAASATAGGNSYAFGTWTNESVAVSLSASNPIGQGDAANLGSTYYAVDNSACGSSFAEQRNLANVPGCSVYTGPFTISSSGKHTVTFFSANLYGFPIIGPIPMPPQIPPLPCPNPNANPCNVQLLPLVPPLEGILQSAQVLVDKNPPLSSTPDTMTIPQGESASYTINLGHVGWAGQTINLSCTTDAQLSGCTMLPTSVTLDATNSNASVATVVTTLTGGLPGQAALVQQNPFGPWEALRFLLAFTMAAFLVAMARALRAQRWLRVTHFAALALLFGWLSAGCNSAAQIPGTPRGAYTVTITGTSGMTTNTVQTKLVVK